MRRPGAWLCLATILLLPACVSSTRSDPMHDNALVGAWRSRLQFTSGAFAGITDLQFMTVYNAGGTLTESSNYDGAPPVPPAYGVWRRIGPDRYEAAYEFYSTRPPARLDEIATGGWLPAGHGRLVEHIALAPDGWSYTSTIRYTAFGTNGQPVDGGGEANAEATRIDF